ncbi:MAG: type IV pilin protein [Burkholderiales bacterium]
MSRGFTLIEVMITVAIVGILAAIALPSYSDYVRRSKIIEATGRLGDQRVQMEQYFLDNRTYAGVGEACGVASPVFDSKRDAFRITCSGASTTGYLLTATGVDSMAGFVYTVDPSDNRRTTGVPKGWTANNSCWVLRKSGECQ